MKKLGCSTRIFVILAIVFLALLIFGFVIGPIGSKLFNIEVPEVLKLHEPHVSLPSEPVTHIGAFTITNTLLASWLTIIVLAVVFYFATRKVKLIPGRFQAFVELIVEAILNFVKQGAGEKNARLLFPIVATIFLYVITNAYLALLPFFGTIGLVDEHHHYVVSILRAANTDINLPLSIAVIAFLFIEYLGIRAHGLFPYVKEFFNFSKIRDGFSHLFKGKIGPALGSIFYGFIDLFIGAIEVLSHWIRIISFTFRLFGNMTAGEILLLLIMFLVPMLVVIPFFGLELLVGILQALIFAGLTLVFGVMALSSHSEEH